MDKMIAHRTKRIPSQYKYVSGSLLKGVVRWTPCYKGLGTVYYDSERQAAISVDRHLIMLGKSPINVLVSVK
jgi:hypothetical protein